MRRREGILLLALLIGAVVYLIVNGTDFPPSADAQEPVAAACLKRAGFKVESDQSDTDDFKYELDVEDENGARLAIVYLTDTSQDPETFAAHLKDYQKTYGDYKGETIEQRGTAVIRLAEGFERDAAIHTCVDRAAKAKDT